MEKKKVVNWVIAFVLTAGIVAAIWILGPVSTTGAYSINSQKVAIGFIENLSSTELDASNGFSFIDSAVLDVNKNNQKVLIDTLTTKTDIADLCTDYENDCSVEYWLNCVDSETYGYGSGTCIELNESSVQYLDTGLNNLYLNITCLEWSCSQDISAALTITPLKK